MPYSQEDKYKSRHSIKEGASRHQRGQQGCPAIERRIVAAKNNGRDHNDQEKNNSREKQHIQGNQEEHNKRERSCSSIEERQPNLGRRWSGLHRRKNLYAK